MLKIKFSLFSRYNSLLSELYRGDLLTYGNKITSVSICTQVDLCLCENIHLIKMLPKEVTMKLEECYARNINIAELARQMNFTRGYIQHVMAGRRKAGKHFLAALEKVPVEAVTKQYVQDKKD